MYEPLHSLNLQGSLNPSAPGLSPEGQNSLAVGSWNTMVNGDGYIRPYRGFLDAVAGGGSAIMFQIGRTWGGIRDNAPALAAGSFFEDIGQSRWGLGSGIPHIAGTAVPSWVLSTLLQVSVKTRGTYGAPVQAGLPQPSAPEVGVISALGTLSNSISCKIERTRPSTGARSLASPTSAVIVPQSNRARVTFPLASPGQTHWRVYFTFQGFGGVGIHYLCLYNGVSDIPESVVATGTVGGSATQATGTITFSGLPLNNETITINGVVFTFKTSATGGDQVQIGASATETAANLAAVLTASTDAAVQAATYTASAGVVTVASLSFGVGSAGPPATGNSFALAESATNVVVSGATLTGGADGDFTRSLEFNYNDGDLIPIEASYDDYPPPPATHALKLQNVLNLVGCYADSVASPTTLGPGTAIAVSKPNNYESYIPTHLLYLPEPVVDVLARPIDDYGYVACANSIHAVQYVGDRGEDFPPCAVTTVLPDVGIAYPSNWCQFRGQLLMYTAQGSLIMMTEDGAFDSSFASPVVQILAGFAPADTVVGYDPQTDCIIVGNGKRILVYSLQRRVWRQIWIPDFRADTTIVSAVTALQQLYLTLDTGGTLDAVLFDQASAVSTPVSIVTNPQVSPGGIATVKDVYEIAVAMEGTMSQPLVMAVRKNLNRIAYREINNVGAPNDEIRTPATDPFTADDIENKMFALFYPDVGGFGTEYVIGRLNWVNSTEAQLKTLGGAALTLPIVNISDMFMLVGDYIAARSPVTQPNPKNFFPNLTEARAYQVGFWLRSTSAYGNVLACDLFGAAYPSSRAL